MSAVKSPVFTSRSSEYAPALSMGELIIVPSTIKIRSTMQMTAGIKQFAFIIAKKLTFLAACSSSVSIWDFMLAPAADISVSTQNTAETINTNVYIASDWKFSGGRTT